jgi:hypothetical protein
MDHRLDTEGIEPEYKNEDRYGPKREYVREFEKNPTATVKKIVAEIKEKKLGEPIQYDPDTRLYAVADKPADWSQQELPGSVKTGKFRDQLFTLVIKKC